MKKGLLLFALPLSAACAAPRVAINRHADFSAVKRVAVLTFGGEKGDVAADLLTQSLLTHGADVIERQKLGSVMAEQSMSSSGVFDPSAAKQLGRVLGVDALFVGTVAQSTPPGAYLVSPSKDPVVTGVAGVSGRNVRAEGSVPGLPNAYVLSTAANVSLVSRMVDVETGSILWSASMSYEGFDVPAAMAAITDSFIRSLDPVWPALYHAR